jgi:hypothetical protein
MARKKEGPAATYVGAGYALWRIFTARELSNPRQEAGGMLPFRLNQ